MTVSATVSIVIANTVEAVCTLWHLAQYIHSVLQLFHEAENGLKRIATVGNAKGTNLPLQERQVRLNVMRGFAVDLQELSKQFRAQQKDFVLRTCAACCALIRLTDFGCGVWYDTVYAIGLKGRDEIGSNIFGAEEKDSAPALTEILDRVRASSCPFCYLSLSYTPATHSLSFHCLLLLLNFAVC